MIASFTRSSLLGLVILCGALGGATARAAARIDPALAAFARAPETAPAARVIALMDLTGLTPVRPPQRYDRRAMNLYLRQLNQLAWKKVEQSLRASGALRTTTRPRSLFWVNNSVAVDVSPTGLRALANAPGVDAIFLSKRIGGEPARRGRRFLNAGGGRGAPFAYHIEESGLGEVIRTLPQVTGRGVVIGSIDSGADGTHPALAGKIALFYDASTGRRSPVAIDYTDHGTHTTGTLVGGDRANNVIGVAPDARVILAAGFTPGPAAHEVYDALLSSMQFLLDPDDNPNTDDQPRTINNSWTSVEAPDQELFYRAISAWEAAGILPVFSAGNTGELGPRTITPPHEHPLAFAVGSTVPGGLIAPESSRGPGDFNGKPTQKPDLTAPGADIRSCLPGEQYGELSGTSMAAAQVTGAAALLFQVNPNLTPQQVREILLRTVTPVSASDGPGVLGRWNANYGFGRLNIAAAVRLAIAGSQPRRHGPNFLMGGSVHGLGWMETDLERSAREIAGLRPATFSLEELSPRIAGVSADWPTLD